MCSMICVHHVEYHSGLSWSATITTNFMPRKKNLGPTFQYSRGCVVYQAFTLGETN